MPRPSRLLMSSPEFEDLATRLSTARAVAAPDLLAGLGSVVTGTVIAAGDQPAEPPMVDDSPARVGSPSPYRLRQWQEHGAGWWATNDRLELDIHGATAMTHIDAPNHFTWPPVRAEGTPADAVTALSRSGLVGRGILIDVPGLLGPLQPGDVVTLDDLLDVLDRTDVTVQRGDALYLRFGREGVAHSDVPLGSAPTSGLSIECAEWLANAGLSLVVTDEGLDPVPSEVDGQPVPWHLLLITALGLPLVDRAQLGPLAGACAAAGRWAFLSVVAPLPIPQASGSPVNPLAIL